MQTWLRHACVAVPVSVFVHAYGGCQHLAPACLNPCSPALSLALLLSLSLSRCGECFDGHPRALDQTLLGRDKCGVYKHAAHLGPGHGVPAGPGRCRMLRTRQCHVVGYQFEHVFRAPLQLHVPGRTVYPERFPAAGCRTGHRGEYRCHVFVFREESDARPVVAAHPHLWSRCISGPDSCCGLRGGCPRKCVLRCALVVPVCGWRCRASQGVRAYVCRDSDRADQSLSMYAKSAPGILVLKFMCKYTLLLCRTISHLEMLRF